MRHTGNVLIPISGWHITERGAFGKSLHSPTYISGSKSNIGICGKHGKSHWTSYIICRWVGCTKSKSYSSIAHMAVWVFGHILVEVWGHHKSLASLAPLNMECHLDCIQFCIQLWWFPIKRVCYGTYIGALISEHVTLKLMTLLLCCHCVKNSVSVRKTFANHEHYQNRCTLTVLLKQMMMT